MRNIEITKTYMNEFNEFINYMEMVYVLSIGNKFTWSNKKGSTKSRPDRFLLCESLVDSRKIIGQIVGDKDISDYSLVQIKANKMDWGPKPFRVNSYWFENKDFKGFMVEP